MRWDAKVTAHHVDEERIALGCPHRCDVADGPNGDANQPEAQPETDCPGQRAVHDRYGAWRTTEQDRLGQGSMDWNGEARHFVSLVGASHQIRGPPLNEKNDRKKLDAAKAIDRTNTI